MMLWWLVISLGWGTAATVTAWWLWWQLSCSQESLEVCEGSLESAYKLLDRYQQEREEKARQTRQEQLDQRRRRQLIEAVEAADYIVDWASSEGDRTVVMLRDLGE